MRTPLALLALTLALLAPPARSGEGFFTLEGHGGPVRGIDVRPDGGAILTASFDTSIGLWIDGQPRWLEGHEAGVNVVKFVDAGRAVSGGDDATVRLWDLQSGAARVLGRHGLKVLGLAVSPDGSRVASASWDGTAALWPLYGEGAALRLEPRAGPLNDVAFSADGRLLYTAAADGSLHVWQLDAPEVPRLLLKNGFGINRLLVNDASGWLVFGAVDGVSHVVDIQSGEVLSELTLGRRPVLALALDPAGRLLAMGDGKGYITLFDTSDWSIVADFRASAKGPIWALAFTPDGEAVLAGGLDDAVWAFPVEGTRAPPRMGAELAGRLAGSPEASNGERLFRRRCSVCHTLEPDSRRRAGPTLMGLFGRKAGAIEGYRYTDALANSGIVWNEETIDKLFDLGPDVYVEGTKMPVQRIPDARNRADLIEFLKLHTATRETRTR